MEEVVENNQCSDRIDLLIDQKAKETIQAAALLRRKTIREFILEIAMGAANEILAGSRHFHLDAEQ